MAFFSLRQGKAEWQREGQILVCCQSQELKEGGESHPNLWMDGNGKWRRTGSSLCPGPQEKTLGILEMGVISGGNGYLLSVSSLSALLLALKLRRTRWGTSSSAQVFVSSMLCTHLLLSLSQKASLSKARGIQLVHHYTPRLEQCWGVQEYRGSTNSY